MARMFRRSMPKSDYTLGALPSLLCVTRNTAVVRNGVEVSGP